MNVISHGNVAHRKQLDSFVLIDNSDKITTQMERNGCMHSNAQLISNNPVKGMVCDINTKYVSSK